MLHRPPLNSSAALRANLLPIRPYLPIHSGKRLRAIHSAPLGRLTLARLLALTT